VSDLCKMVGPPGKFSRMKLGPETGYSVLFGVARLMAGRRLQTGSGFNVEVAD